MKSIKIFSVCIVALLGLSSCASSWLDQELTGSTITQEEYNTMNNVAVGSVKGIYAALYTYGNAGSGHDAFGQKAIDIASDLTSSDMALTNQLYGWFYSDAARVTSSRSYYIWVMYYNMIMNANAVMRSLDKKSAMSVEETGAYAQALAIRAYCYYNIANLYGPTPEDDTWPSSYGRKGYGKDYDLAPIYTQNDTTAAGLIKERPMSTYQEVREFVNQDLVKAITLFEACGFQRTSKLYIDINVARGLLAYNKLQMAWIYDGEAKTKCLNEAAEYATDVINSGEYTILPYSQLTTTGFTDQSASNWMWGLDVTQENTGSLATFWGHVDIYTYSYAYAGDAKAMDQNLYVEFKKKFKNDGRLNWFDSKNDYGLVPCGKFYDIQGKATGEIDRDWLNDVVYMRIEEMYLIAAEAYWRLGNEGMAYGYMEDLLEERMEDVDDLDPKYQTGQDLADLIYLNWRVEMFAEGRALMTLKRFAPDGYTSKTRGDNHVVYAGKEMKTSDYRILYIMPSSEANYNNEIND